MIVFKFKNRNGEYIFLKNIKNIKITLRNKPNDTKTVLSHGWKNSLEGVGDKCLIIKVTGIADQSEAEGLLREFSFENSTLDCELLFTQESLRQERLSTKCFIELYERYSEARNLDHFTAILVSNGPVTYHESVI